LADELGVSVSAIERRTAELKALGLISIKRRGLGKTNRYRFPTHIWSRQKPPAPAGRPEADPETDSRALVADPSADHPEAAERIADDGHQTGRPDLETDPPRLDRPSGTDGNGPRKTEGFRPVICDGSYLDKITGKEQAMPNRPQIESTAPPSTPLAGRLFSRFQETCQRIEAHRIHDPRPAARGFDPRRFFDIQAARFHPESVLLALDRIAEQWATIRNPATYGLSIAERESGNFFERDHQHQTDETRRAADSAMERPELKALLGGCGTRPDGCDPRQPAESKRHQAPRPAPKSPRRPTAPPKAPAVAGADAERNRAAMERNRSEALEIIEAAKRHGRFDEIAERIKADLKSIDRKRIERGKAAPETSIGFQNALTRSDFGFLEGPAADEFRAEVAEIRARHQTQRAEN
jgi:hypothetical protein